MLISPSPSRPLSLSRALVIGEPHDLIADHQQPAVAGMPVDQPLDFDQARELAAGGAAIDDFEGQEAVEFGPQQLMGRAVPERVPLVLDPADDGGVAAGDFDFGGHQQAVACAEADPHLRIVPHQVGDVQRERRQLVDPHRGVLGPVQARHPAARRRIRRGGGLEKRFMGGVRGLGFGVRSWERLRDGE